MAINTKHLIEIDYPNSLRRIAELEHQLEDLKQMVRGIIYDDIFVNYPAQRYLDDDQYNALAAAVKEN